MPTRFWQHNLIVGVMLLLAASWMCQQALGQYSLSDLKGFLRDSEASKWVEIVSSKTDQVGSELAFNPGGLSHADPPEETAAPLFYAAFECAALLESLQRGSGDGVKAFWSKRIARAERLISDALLIAASNKARARATSPTGPKAERRRATGVGR